MKGDTRRIGAAAAPRARKAVARQEVLTVPPELIGAKVKSRAEFAAERAERAGTTQRIEVEPPPQSPQEESPKPKRLVFAVALLATLAGALAVVMLRRSAEIAPEPSVQPVQPAPAEQPSTPPVAAPSLPAVTPVESASATASAKPLTPPPPPAILPRPSAPAAPTARESRSDDDMPFIHLDR